MSNCVICSVEVTDEVLKHVYYDPDHPTIDFGPYCPTCAGKIRRCSGCYHPFTVDEVTYHGKGVYLCGACRAQATVCESCDTLVGHVRTVGGKKICESCFSINYKECGCCGEYKDKGDFITDPLIRRKYKGMFSKHSEWCNTCFEGNKHRFKRYEVDRCVHCGDFFTEGEGEDHYCPDCVRRLPRCSHCKKISRNYREYAQDGSFGNGGHNVYLCRGCHGKVTTCGCGKVSKDPVVVRGILSAAKVCKICSSAEIKQCPICLKVATLNDDGVCYSCDNTYVKNICRDCGSLRDGDGSCRVCDNSRIYNYSLKPLPYFHYTDKDVKTGENLFFGIEREISFGGKETSCRESLKELYRKCDPSLLVCKSDGSIDGYGYEIVTQPMTMDYFNKKFPVSDMFHSDIKVSRSCGMHIHVDRKCLKSDVHLYKVVEFIHNNEAFIKEICGRDYNSYSARLGKKASSAVKDKGSTGRTCRVNLTNPKTIEFRMFAQAANEFEFKYRVEFTVAVFKWAKVSSIKAINVPNFRKFVEDNNKTYPTLHKYLSLNN